MAYMTKEDEEYIKGQLQNYLENKGIDTRKKFQCLNPEHADSDPSMSLNKRTNRVHCFGCGVSYSTIDLIGLDYGLTDTGEIYKKAAELYGISSPIEHKESNKKKEKMPIKESKKEMEKKENSIATEEKKISYKDFILEAARNIEKTDYHRGISIETLKKYKVGYVEKWKLPLEVYLRDHEDRTKEKWEKLPESQRLIIPTGDGSYLARAIKDNLTPEESRYKKINIGGKEIFNAEIIGKAEHPVYVVEGELDALSIIDVGGEAVAICSLTGRRKFLDYVKTHRANKPFIIALDNEDKDQVRAAEEELINGLKELNIDAFSFKVSGEYKDANEALCKNRELLMENVALYKDIELTSVTEEREKLHREAVSFALEDFETEVNSKNNDFIPTGYKPLDKILYGGLRSGLYVMGAVSSLGKTTFCLQMADQIAAAGHKVLYFSLEMSRFELMGRSISRNTFLKALEEAKKAYKGRYNEVLEYAKVHAKSTIEITAGQLYKGYSPTDLKLIQTAKEEYKQYASNIWITEGVGDISVEHIKEKVKHFIDVYKEAPVVFVDYIQILAPYNDRGTDKQNMDKSVVELKRMSRDYKIPVVCVSSFNRENYTAPVNEASFKESGGLEYTADVLIGLQYNGMDKQTEADKMEDDKKRTARIEALKAKMISRAKAGIGQEIQVKILKNRNGFKGDYVTELYPKYNYFSTEEIAQNTGTAGNNNKNVWINDEEDSKESDNWLKTDIDIDSIF